MPIDRLPGVIYDFRNEMIKTYALLSPRRRPKLAYAYLELFSDLVDDPDWHASLRRPTACIRTPTVC